MRSNCQKHKSEHLVFLLIYNEINDSRLELDKFHYGDKINMTLLGFLSEKNSASHFTKTVVKAFTTSFVLIQFPRLHKMKILHGGSGGWNIFFYREGAYILEEDPYFYGVDACFSDKDM